MSTSKAKQPNSRHCFVCGLENISGLGLTFYEDGPGQVSAECNVPENYQGYPGFVHGGIVSAMLDEAMGRAVMVGDHTHFTVTAKVEVRFREPVPIDRPLRLVGRIERQRGRFSFASASLRKPDGTLLADAEGMLADFPGKFGESEQLAALGWKVYPD